MKSEKSNTQKWDMRFLGLAREVSTWSKDPSTKIGAVFVDPDTRNILSVGYNGFPRGIEDTERRLNKRDVKYHFIVHGEMNGIFNATLNGVSLRGSTVYTWNLPVCSTCARALIQVGAKRVVECYPLDISDKWLRESSSSRMLFREAGLSIVSYTQEFFLDETEGREFREGGPVLPTTTVTPVGGPFRYEPILSGSDPRWVSTRSTQSVDDEYWCY